MKRALVLPVLLALAACADSPEVLGEKAASAFAANQHGQARLFLIEALKTRPDDRGLLLLQARNHIALGDGDAAAAVLAKLAGKQPLAGTEAELAAEAALLVGRDNAVAGLLGTSTSPEAERMRALVAMRKGDMPLAETIFARGAKAGGNARLLADYARFKQLTGDQAAATQLAARAARLAPDALDTLLVSGQLALAAGDLKRALASYERASSRYPESLAALTGKAAVLGDLKRFDEMEPIVRRAADFAPTDITVAYLAARLASERKDWAGVRAALQPVEERLEPGHPSRLLYAQALLRLDQPGLAAAQLNTILREQPNNRQVRMIAAEAQLAGGDAQAALPIIAVVAGQVDARPEELQLAARIAKAAGNPAAAEAYARRLRSPAVQSLMADLSEGDSALRKQDWARAIIAYERVLAATDGRNPVVLNNMAHSQFMVGNVAQARAFAARALKAAPDNGSVLDTAGWIEFKTGGDHARALELLRMAAQKSPDNPTIRAHLAEAGRAPK